VQRPRPLGSTRTVGHSLAYPLGRARRDNRSQRSLSQEARFSDDGLSEFGAVARRIATECLRAGVHPKVVSEGLGHSSVAFTMDVYSHLLPSMQQEAAAAIEAALGVGKVWAGPRDG
jgi:integrase